MTVPQKDLMTTDDVPERMDVQTYAAWAARTEANHWDPDCVPPGEMARGLMLMMHVGSAMDKIKRALFYGKAEFAAGAWALALDTIARIASEPVIQDNHRAMYHRIEPGRFQQLHASIGVMTEAGEIAELLYARIVLGSKEDDLAKWREEWGDLSWYLARGADALQSPLDTVIWPGNIRKLVTRYPGKFDKDVGNGKRDYEAERRAQAGASAVTPDGKDRKPETEQQVCANCGEPDPLRVLRLKKSGETVGCLHVTKTPDVPADPDVVAHDMCDEFTSAMSVYDTKVSQADIGVIGRVLWSARGIGLNDREVKLVWGLWSARFYYDSWCSVKETDGTPRVACIVEAFDFFVDTHKDDTDGSKTSARQQGGSEGQPG